MKVIKPPIPPVIDPIEKKESQHVEEQTPVLEDPMETIFSAVKKQILYQNKKGVLLDPVTVQMLLMEIAGKLARTHLDASSKRSSVSSEMDSDYIQETVKLIAVLSAGLRYYLDIFNADFE